MINFIIGLHLIIEKDIKINIIWFHSFETENRPTEPAGNVNAMSRKGV